MFLRFFIFFGVVYPDLIGLITPGKGTFSLSVIPHSICASFHQSPQKKIKNKKYKNLPLPHTLLLLLPTFSNALSGLFIFFHPSPPPLLASWQETKLMQLLSPTIHMANSRTWRLFSRNTRKACPTQSYQVPIHIQTFKPSSILFFPILLFHLHTLPLPFEFSYFYHFLSFIL